MEEERRARETAMENGIDIEEFDAGNWSEVKTKKKSAKGKGGAKHRRGGARDEDFGVESLRI
jgi:hypothetical protein